MVKLIQIPGQTVSSTSGNRLVNLTSAYETINRNIKEREKQARIDTLRAEQARFQEEAKKATSFGNVAKLTGQNIWGGIKGIGSVGKEFGKEVVGTTAAVGADLYNVLRPWRKKDIDSVNIFGKEFITPSARGSRAGELVRQGEYEKAAGELGTGALDIVSTIWIPGKGIQILKGGKYVKGALQGGIAGAGYGAGYGTTGAMREGAGAKETLKSGAVGAGIGIGAGAILGAGTALVGKLFSRKAEIIEKPQVFTELVGKPKNAIDYMATRPNLKIVETKNLGKSIDGGKIQSRLEWDYKNNKGILLMTKNTSDEAFAHEIGHYIDKSNPNLVDTYKKEVIALSGGKQNLNEDFAFAVKEIITNPEARKIAPGLTSEVESLGIKLDEGFGVKIETPEAPQKPKIEPQEALPTKKVETPAKTKKVDTDPLIQEARKYKSAEEFVNENSIKHISQEQVLPKKQGDVQFYHGTDVLDYDKLSIPKFEGSTMDRNYGDYFYITPDRGLTETYGRYSAGFNIPKEKVLSLDNLRAEYKKLGDNSINFDKFTDEQFKKYWAIEMPDNEYIVKDVSKIRDYTKSQLTDIWNKSQPLQEVNPLIQEARKPVSKAQVKRLFEGGEYVKTNDGYGNTYFQVKGKLPDEYLTHGIKENPLGTAKRNMADVAGKADTKLDISEQAMWKGFKGKKVLKFSDGSVVQKQYVDEILSKYPNAKPFTNGDLKNTPIVFKEGDNVVGLTMPIADAEIEGATKFIPKQVKSQPLQEGVKPKKTSEIKKTMSETPTAVQNVAKKTYQKELKGGATKKQATKKAIEKVEVYEKKIDKIAKEVSIIEQLKEARKKQGPTPRKKVKTDGVNWETLNTSDETDDLLKSIYAENEQFKDVRPSRTNQDIIEGARAVGIDVNNPAELDKVLRDMPNANTALKLKQSMVDSANDLMNYLKTIDTGTATAEQLNKVKDKFLRTQAIAKAFSGLRTESSHLLRSMGIEVREGENMAEMATKLKEILGESTDTSSFIRKSQEIINPTVIDTVQAIWYNSILSGWKTWARNILDTTNSFIAETISKGVNPATIIEVPRFVAGLVRGFPKSIVKAGKVLIGSEQFSNKMEYTTRVAPYFKNKHLNFWATEVSGRILSAQDVVFHSTAKSALDMIDTFAKQMKKLGVDERTALEVNEAMNKKLTDRIVYRNEPMGSIGAVSKGIGEIATKVKALKFIVPFTRVVANVTDRKIDYLPILNIARTFGKKYINEEARIILKSTSIPPSQYDKLMPIITKRLRDQQLGRLYLGTLFSVGAYGLASNGRLSGAGPSNANERKQLQDTGWRPYSVKIGDKWIPYTYFGPLSGILAGAGSIHDSIKYDRKGESPTKLVANGLFGFAQNLMTTSFIQGVGDIFEVLSGRGLKPADYIRNFILGLAPIPAMWTQTTQALDGKSYDIQTWGEAIQWKLGISKDGLPLTKNLTPRLNALGEDIRSDLIYGITPAKERKEIQTKLTDMGLIINVPAKTTKLGDETMTREQLFEYTKRRGDLIKKNLEQILSSVEAKQSKDEKEKEFKKWIDNIGDEAKNEMKIKYSIEQEKKYSPKSLIKPQTITIIK
jgi:hypothetical protein